jgi:hypothetical protein
VAVFEEILRGFSVAILFKASSRLSMGSGCCSEVKFAFAERWATYEGKTKRHVGFSTYRRVEKDGKHIGSILEDVYVDVHDTAGFEQPNNTQVSEPTSFVGEEAWTHKVVTSDSLKMD